MICLKRDSAPVVGNIVISIFPIPDDLQLPLTENPSFTAEKT